MKVEKRMTPVRQRAQKNRRSIADPIEMATAIDGGAGSGTASARARRRNVACMIRSNQ